MKPLSECRLYTFVDTAYLHGRSPQAVAQGLCDGGSDLIQLRAKGSSLDEIRQLAEAILQVTRRAGVRLVLNDHPQVAAEVGAQLCHLGQEDFFNAGYTHVSQLSTPGRQLNFGLSTPVYATGTKPTARPVTLDYVRWAAAKVKIAWFAIGGIQLQNLDEVLAAGARRICVVSAILTAPDIGGACQQFKNRLPSVGR